MLLYPLLRYIYISHLFIISNTLHHISNVQNIAKTIIGNLYSCLYSHKVMKKIFQHMRAILQSTVDTILPPRCPINGEVVDVQGMLSSQAWGGLEFVSKPLCHCCGIPFDFQVNHDGEGELCMVCMTERPVFAKARAALVYNDTSRALILGFKHGDKMHVVRSFIPWLLSAGKEILVDADIIIPVPLHRSRLIARRYNQAALIAEMISKSACIEYNPYLLKRTRATDSQGHMKAKEREKNVSNAFEIPAKFVSQLSGKKIVLVDDVYTTGATVKECTRALLESGAKDVSVLAVARVIDS